MSSDGFCYRCHCCCFWNFWIFYIYDHVICKWRQLDFSLPGFNAFYFFFIYLLLVQVLWLWLSVLCWINVVGVGIFAFFLILEQKLSVFHCWVICLLWSFHMCHYCVEVRSFCTQFAESFCHERMLNIVKSFSASIEMIMNFSPFCQCSVLCWLICVILHHPCIPWINHI